MNYSNSLWVQLNESEKRYLTEFFNEIMYNKKIPESYPEIINKMDLFNMILKDSFAHHVGYSLVSYDWVKLLKELVIKTGNCLEVMAGKGMLTKALQDIGVNCIATDDYSWNFDFENNLFTEVEKLDCIEAINKYGKNVDFLIMSWVPYTSPIGYDALKTYKSINPKGTVIYIGEDCGGCTANDEFYDMMYDIMTEKNIKLAKKLNELYMNWYGIYDKIFII